MPFEYFEVTAEVGIRAWGKDLAEAFCEAARALFELMVDTAAVRPHQTLTVELSAESKEMLLADWLNRLILERDRTGYASSQNFSVKISRSAEGFVLSGASPWRAIGSRAPRPTHRRQGRDVQSSSSDPEARWGLCRVRFGYLRFLFDSFSSYNKNIVKRGDIYEEPQMGASYGVGALGRQALTVPGQVKLDLEISATCENAVLSINGRIYSGRPVTLSVPWGR
jgi:SHS2 domain-containing protein